MSRWELCQSGYQQSDSESITQEKLKCRLLDLLLCCCDNNRQLLIVIKIKSVEYK